VTRPRFFAPDLDPSRDQAVLPADESRHLVRVMRLRDGDEVTVFDGRGHEFRALVERADRKAVTLRILEAIASLPEPGVPTVLVQAVLKGDKMDGVVRDATMAGVARITPVVTDHSIVSMSALARGHALDRWQRVAVASAKQSRLARLPAIDLPRPFRDWLAAPFVGLRLLLAEPSAGADDVRPMRTALAAPRPPAIACIVGPEGGWSTIEREAARQSGCVAVTLGPTTLRADAVGLVALCLVNFAFEGS
jgi:16S rRNA (uracil1498-N3)-methyltransferase